MDERIVTKDAHDLGELVGRGMNEGMRLLAEVDRAEAEVERLERDLHAAMEHARLARQRYDANRDLTRSMWETLRTEIEGRQRVEEPSRG